MTGPTQNYADPTLATRRARPALAVVVRAATATLPLLLALVVGAVAALVLPPGRLGVAPWLWLVGVVATTSAVLYVCSRLLRRLAPLSALLRISLVLPDDVPHRFALARRRWSPQALEDSASAIDDGPSQRLLALVATLAAHDAKTRAHGERVQAYAALIGRELGLPEADVERLSWAALLHDVGKVHVAPDIINKAGKPTEEEWAQIQGHPCHGGELVEPLRGWLGDWLDGVEQHHERFDGKGYPRRLAGQDISLAARIIAVADTYDVITSARAYKKPMTAEQARAEITRCAGEQFDPVVVRALLSVGIAKLRRVAGPATLLALLPVVIAAPAQAAPSVGAVLQAAGGQAATAVLAAGVGVTGGVASAEALAAPQTERVFAVKQTGADIDADDTSTSGTRTDSRRAPEESADDAARSAAQATDPAGISLGLLTPSEAASASPTSPASAEAGASGPAGPGAATPPAVPGSTSSVPSPGADVSRPTAVATPATSARASGTGTAAPAPRASRVDTSKKATQDADKAADEAARDAAKAAEAAHDAADEAAEQAAKDAEKAAKDQADAAKAAQAAADKAAKQAAKDAADAAKAAADAAAKQAGDAAKKAAETAGKLTGGLTSGLTAGRTSTSSAATPAPSSSTSSSGSLTGGLLGGSR